MLNFNGQGVRFRYALPYTVIVLYQPHLIRTYRALFFLSLELYLYTSIPTLGLAGRLVSPVSHSSGPLDLTQGVPPSTTLGHVFHNIGPHLPQLWVNLSFRACWPRLYFDLP